MNSAELCRKNGWKAGTVLEGRNFGFVNRIQITAVGEALVLARLLGVKRDSEEEFTGSEKEDRTWDLTRHNWEQIFFQRGPRFRRWRDTPTAKEKPPYWEQLQDIIEVAAQLQASPIPDDEMLQQINLMRLGYAEYELAQIQLTLPFVRHLPPAPIVKWPLTKDSFTNEPRSMLAHDFYVTGDSDAPDSIKDPNGAVVLTLCRRCGQAEDELTLVCLGKPSEESCPVVKTPPTE